MHGKLSMWFPTRIVGRRETVILVRRESNGMKMRKRNTSVGMLALVSLLFVAGCHQEPDIIEFQGTLSVSSMNAAPNPVKEGHISTITFVLDLTGIGAAACWNATLSKAAGGTLDVQSGLSGFGRPISLHLLTKHTTDAVVTVTATREMHLGVCGQSIQAQRSITVKVMP